VEVTDGGSCVVFVIFDSEMAYLMEKSCAYFVSQSKVFDCCFFFSNILFIVVEFHSFFIIFQVCSGASHPIEFDGLAGKRVLFCVQKSPQLGLAISSYRVKRICANPIVIEQFFCQNSCSTSSKVVAILFYLISFIHMFICY
jgi:hypothetical protein